MLSPVFYSTSNGVKTSGESNTEIAIRIVRRPSVDVRTISISVAEVHELAIRIAAFLLHFSILVGGNMQLTPLENALLEEHGFSRLDGDFSLTGLKLGVACINMRRDQP